MKVSKKFSPTTIEIETEEELGIVIEALTNHYWKHRNGWHIINGNAAKQVADVTRVMVQKIEGIN
jgi:hypothetical protein